MINPKLPALWHGGDYNPEQWPRDTWNDDVRLMKAAGVNVATVGVFSWVTLQPAEDTFAFDWLDDVINLLHENNIFVCLATATAAQPAWLSAAYPEVLPVGRDGRPMKHGERQRVCPSSLVFREKAAGLARRLAERYGTHPALVLWHISNEYGTHCYCEKCARGFQAWCRARYNTLDAVNAAWSATFWGHTFTAWEQIDTPTTIGERSMLGYLLDYERFQNDAILECYLGEHAALREVTPTLPITTNLMGTFKPLDYHAWGPRMDVVSWDSYPTKNASPASTALRHALMRGLRGGQPFLLMEQTPSQVNWAAHCALKRPGQMRLLSYQAIAHGADSAMYFQWRRSRGSFEKFHGAVVEHAGHENTRVFGEVATLGRELAALGEQIVDARTPARVAVLFDWNNWWALENSAGPSKDLTYCPQVERYYGALHELNIPTDVIAPLADFDGYDVIVAPVLYLLQPGVAARLEAFVQAGGTFVTTFFSGMVDQNDRVTLGGYPGELRQLLGVWNEEIDALLPGETNAVVFDEPFGELAGSHPCRLICERLHLEGARTLAHFATDFYANEPAITENRFGAGLAYYVATDLDPAVVRGPLAELCRAKSVTAPLENAPPGVEVAQRVKDDTALTFVLNHNAAPATITLSLPATDLLTGRALPAGPADLPGYGVLILRSPTQ